MSDSPSRSEIHAALDTLTFEVALLYFRMTIAADQLLGEGRHSSGRRSLLKSLGRDGPQTVPAMARVRSVSRQHIQTLVNVLRRDGLVRPVPNPAHRRSHLIALTERGERFLRGMHEREAELLAGLGAGIPVEQLRTATRIVRELRARLESDSWREAVQRSRKEAAPAEPG